MVAMVAAMEAATEAAVAATALAPAAMALAPAASALALAATALAPAAMALAPAASALALAATALAAAAMALAAVATALAAAATALEAQAPMAAEAQAPMAVEAPAPMAVEAQAPMAVEAPAPMAVEAQAPMAVEAQAPGSGSTGTYGSGSTGTYGSGSTGTYGSGSTGTYGSGSTGTYGSGSTGTYGSGSTGTYGSGSTGTYGSGSTGTYGSGSTGTYGSGSTGTYGSGSTGTYGSGSTGTYGSGSTGTYGSGTGTYGSGSTGTYGSGSTGTYGSGRRLQFDLSAFAKVSGFGTDGTGKSVTGSTSYSWSGALTAQPGNYRVCWCGGLSATCSSEFDYIVDAGTIAVSGPYDGQELSCIKGQPCINKGPILGAGFTAGDQVWVRNQCSLASARSLDGADVSVLATVSLQPGLQGDPDMYISVDHIIGGTPVPAGNYVLCWCSSKGQSCSDMNLTQGSPSTVYLEAKAASVKIEGPGTGAEVECFLGQLCRPELPSEGAISLQAYDKVSAMESCGQGGFLLGLPGTGIAVTADGYIFDFEGVEYSPYLESYPGFFRLCWCRPSSYTQCDQPSDFIVAAGLLIATGPYSGQSHQCVLGAQCIVNAADLRGVSLASGDRLLALTDCVGVVPSRTFPQPVIVPGTVNDTTGTYHFDLGYLELNSSNNPEALQLCWCSTRSSGCDDPTNYRQVAMTFYVACPPGFYELEVVPGSPSQCQECPAGFYCAGGWPADLSPCPAGSVSMRQSVASTDCLCRGGFYWDDSVGACLACPVGKYKDWIGRASGCGKTCPSLTTSSGGAANVWECFCSGNSIDTDSALESFECTDLETLSSNSSERDVFLAVAATVYSFNGSLQVQDASTEALFLEIEDWLHQLLDMASVRARLELSVTFEASNWYVDFIGWSSDRGVAYILQDKFDPIPFQVWIAGMTGTALDSAQLVSCSEVASVLLQCPAGLGLQEGHPIIDLNDCMCPHGKQAAVSGASGLEAGCVPCPLGQYKSPVGDTSCVACPTTPNPLTTLQEGSMSYSACTYICPAGSFNDDPMNPSSCQPCGLGFYCPYKENRGACNESQTTVDEAASSITECLCAPGFLDAGSGACQACATGKYKSLIGNAQCSVCAAGTSASEGQATCDECEAGRFATAGAGTCDPCPAGRYSLNPAATSVDSCVLCPIGTWGNTAAASLMSACVPCVSGSTTALPAADSEALCARPNASHSKTCISGRTCAIDGIAGSSLQDGHRMAITSSACSDAKLAVSGIISSGISKAATQNGGSYEWGDVYTDFTPLGGVYNLCWCASMGILTCDNLNSNFVITPGQLLVTGPFANQLECLRGSDCTDLAFSGYDLLASDQIAVRLDACGRSVAEQISISNVNGLGDLQASGTDWVLGFGVSTNDHDYHLYIDASNAGYFLCWCASERGSNTACATADFAVYAGRLRVTGPNTNQESACAVGQECSVTGIRGVSMQSGDRLMILSDCGRGNAIPGLPSSGILETADGNNFAFVGNVSSVILSVAGIFRICFCRPAGDTCGTAVGFQARVGLMTASGPFDSTTECQLGSNCTVDMSGIGLDVGDQLFFTSGTCGSSNALSELGFTQLQDPVPLEQSASGLQVLLGELPISANPGLYSICWCPKSAACTSPALFRAPAGLLQVDCPPGTFAVGPSTGGLIVMRCSCLVFAARQIRGSK